MPPELPPGVIAAHQAADRHDTEVGFVELPYDRDLLTRERCPARSPGGVTPTGTLPRKGTQCGLERGHDGDHTILIETSAPWFPNKERHRTHAQGRVTYAVRGSMAEPVVAIRGKSS